MVGDLFRHFSNQSVLYGSQQLARVVGTERRKLLFKVFGMIGVVDKTYIDGNSQLRLRRITVGRYCLVVLIVTCDFSVNLQVGILIRLEQLQTGLPDEDIFQVLIELVANGAYTYSDLIGKSAIEMVFTLS